MRFLPLLIELFFILTFPFIIFYLDHDQVYALGLCRRGTGAFAILFLVATLITTPLEHLFKIKKRPLKRFLGVHTFYFATLHVFYFYLKYWTYKNEIYPFIKILTSFKLGAGLAAFTIIFLLFFTSNKFSVRVLKKNWKKLHRLVYFAEGLLFVHLVLQNKIVANFSLVPLSSLIILQIKSKFFTSTK